MFAQFYSQLHSIHLYFQLNYTFSSIILLFFTSILAQFYTFTPSSILHLYSELNFTPFLLAPFYTFTLCPIFAFTPSSILHFYSQLNFTPFLLASFYTFTLCSILHLYSQLKFTPLLLAQFYTLTPSSILHIDSQLNFKEFSKNSDQNQNLYIFLFIAFA